MLASLQAKAELGQAIRTANSGEQDGCAGGFAGLQLICGQELRAVEARMIHPKYMYYTSK